MILNNNGDVYTQRSFIMDNNVYLRFSEPAGDRVHLIYWDGS